MQNDKGIWFLKAMTGNVLGRRVLTSMNKRCDKCGENRLEVALELYVDVREDACIACKLAKGPSPAWSWWVHERSV